jgi:hypothetical protein
MRYAQVVRTTLDVDDNLLLTVKEIALSQNKTAGQVVSELLRRALRPQIGAREYRNGVPLLPRRPSGPPVTSELINRLRDEDE